MKRNDRHVRLSGCVLAWGGRKAETLTAFTTQNVHFTIRDEEKSKIDRPCERYIQLLIQFKLCRTYYLPPQKEIVLVVVTPNNLQLVCCSYTSSVCCFTLSGKLKRVFQRPLFFIDVNADQSEHALGCTPWTDIELRQQNHWKQSWIMDQARNQRPPKPKVS